MRWIILLVFVGCASPEPTSEDEIRRETLQNVSSGMSAPSARAKAERDFEKRRDAQMIDDLLIY